MAEVLRAACERAYSNGPLLLVSASISFATAQMLVKLAGRVQTFEVRVAGHRLCARSHGRAGIHACTLP